MQTIDKNSVKYLSEQLQIVKEKYESQKQMTEMTISYLQDTNAKLTEAKNEIDSVNKRVQQSINYAQRIQRKILPSDHKVERLFPSSFLIYKPKDVVSGDFYFVDEDDTYKYLAVIDCTGHGVPGAFLTLIVNSLLESILKENKGNRADIILKKLDEKLYHYLNKNEGTKRIQDGLDITFCMIEKASNTIIFSSTHQRFYHLSNKEVEEYKGAPYSIGEFSKRQEKLTNVQLQYQKGDLLYLSTDGILDQFGGVNNEKFKRKNFKNLLTKIADYPLEKQKKIIELTFEKWKSDKVQTDDILVMGIML
ncbi:PP2C family protein-serine/threonine phosphatase [Flammeovirga aprica]|uniref:SpoIIE family protein phosphatase n=1 Tax=Flammeovirga aprica JL-4 TaxID=694437 RepID=A0A7X9RW58_9BACT|nr:SpoIIE family protein phosphatase [Flammeovirga aprica]NME69818.1 SpoIIE family protein phosphatase [Flammeovirga aprica JL-4]